MIQSVHHKLRMAMLGMYDMMPKVHPLDVEEAHQKTVSKSFLLKGVVS